MADPKLQVVKASLPSDQMYGVQAENLDPASAGHLVHTYTAMVVDSANSAAELVHW